MKRTIALAFVVFTIASCHRTPETIRVIMENKTQQHMTNFVLDFGEGKISYQIFSKDYTFAEDISVSSIHTMKVEFYDDAGVKIAYQLERPVTPDMAGSTLRIDFKPDAQHNMSIEFPEED